MGSIPIRYTPHLYYVEYLVDNIGHPLLSAREMKKTTCLSGD